MTMYLLTCSGMEFDRQLRDVRFWSTYETPVVAPISITKHWCIYTLQSLAAARDNTYFLSGVSDLCSETARLVAAGYQERLTGRLNRGRLTEGNLTELLVTQFKAAKVQSSV
jgi:hypothetical protein